MLATSNVLTTNALLEKLGKLFSRLGPSVDFRTLASAADLPEYELRANFPEVGDAYASVIRHIIGQRLKVPNEPVNLLGPADQQLRSLVRLMLSGLLRPGFPSWHNAILARELGGGEVSLAFGELIDQVLVPHRDTLSRILDELSGGLLLKSQRERLENTVVAQCLFYFTHQGVLRRMYPHLPNPSERIEELAEHITEVSVAAVARLATSKRTIRRVTTP